MIDGGATTWSFAFDGPLAVAVVAAVAGGLVAWVLYRRQVRTQPSIFRRLLPLLRAASIILILLMLAQPTLTWRRPVEQRGQITLLLDKSGSMAIPDDAMRPARKLLIASLQGQAQAIPEVRQAVEVSRRIRNSDTISDEHIAVALRLLSSATSVAPPLAGLGHVEAPEEGGSVAAEAFRQQMVLDEDASADEPSDLIRAAWADYFLDLSDALAETAAVPALDSRSRQQRASAAAERLEGELVSSGSADLQIREFGDTTSTSFSPSLEAVRTTSGRSAVVLLSDGRQTTGLDQIDAAVARLSSSGTPIHTVLVGSEHPPADVAVEEVLLPDTVFANDAITGSVLLRDTMPGGLELEMIVRRDAEQVARFAFTTTGEGSRVIPFEFSLPAAAQAGPGLVALAFEVTPVDEELTPDNNSRLAAVRVVTTPSRILIVDGRPRWDTRFLVAALTRSGRFDVTAILSPGDDGTIPMGRTGLSSEAEDLALFDAVVFGEVPASAVSESQLSALAQFVEAGGGLMLLDGGRGLLGGYSETPLASLMPVLHGGAESLTSPGLQLTPAGRSTGELGLGQAARSWPSLPPPKRAAAVRAKPGVGEVLLTHGDPAIDRPAIVRSRFGAGRVWYVGFDETWRWRERDGGGMQIAFWTNLINAAATSPFTARDDVARFGVADQSVAAGSRIEVVAQLLGDNGLPRTAAGQAEETVEIRLLRDEQIVDVAAARPSSGGGDTLIATLPAPDEPGLYRLDLRVTGRSESESSASASVLVTPPAASAELARLDADAETLRQIAAATGGQFVYEEEVDQLLAPLRELATQRIISGKRGVWTSWPYFATIVSLLGVEWFLRRRRGLM